MLRTSRDWNATAIGKAKDNNIDDTRIRKQFTKSGTIGGSVASAANHLADSHTERVDVKTPPNFQHSQPYEKSSRPITGSATSRRDSEHNSSSRDVGTSNTTIEDTTQLSGAEGEGYRSNKHSTNIWARHERGDVGRGAEVRSVSPDNRGVSPTRTISKDSFEKQGESAGYMLCRLALAVDASDEWFTDVSRKYAAKPTAGSH